MGGGKYKLNTILCVGNGQHVWKGDLSITALCLKCFQPKMIKKENE